MPLNLFVNLVGETHCLPKLKFVIKPVIMCYKTGLREEYSVSSLAQHVTVHKAYKPTVSV